jgi:hypothetical protein
MSAVQTARIMERQLIMNAHNARSEAGDFKDLTRSTYTDFREAIAKLQACRENGHLNKTRLNEVMNTVLGDSDFGETYDLDISLPGAFWDKVVGLNQSLANVRTVPTAKHIISDNELTMGSAGEDVFRPGVEGTDPTGETVTADTAQRLFIPEEVIGIWSIADGTLEDVIEHGGLEQHIRSLVERAAANEWSKAIWNGTKVGTGNAARGSITACWDGFLQQCQDGGNVLYATAYEDRYVSLIQENDKFLAMAKLLDTKYGNSGFNWITARGILHDMNSEFGQRQTILGDARIQGGYWAGLATQGYPFFHCPALRTNYLVKGTGTVQGTTPVDTTITAIAKSRQKDIVLAAADNTANDLSYVIGADAAGTAFDLNAELVQEDGAISSLTVTLHNNLVRDHASGEIVTEYSAVPTVTGVPVLLADWSNFEVHYQRIMRIEPYRLPRARKTDFVMTARMVPIVLNPDATVLGRDFAVR